MTEFLDIGVGALTLGLGASYFAVFLGVILLVGVSRTFLARRNILDIPNERSSHSAPVPRGGGIGVLVVLLPAWVLWRLADADFDGSVEGLSRIGLPVAAAMVLALVSWIDDVRVLGAAPRLLVHFGAALVGVWSLPGPVFGGLMPPLADGAVSVLILVWFINLFNFMDGIDAISGVEAVVIGLGVSLVGLVAGHVGGVVPLGFMVTAAALGFLVWNWPPARIFLGDVGSTPVGFLLAWLLLYLAVRGHWLSALILPLYYLADSGLTITRRLMRGENITRAHRSHFYQLAVRKGRSHAAVSLCVFAVGVLLVLHAAVAAMFDAATAWPALISATACVIGALIWMAAPWRRDPDGG